MILRKGEYGYHRFDRGEIGSVSYEINLHRSPDIGEHCLSFNYYFSDEISNGKIDLFISNGNLTLNKRIETNLFNNGNQWSLARIPLKIEYFITNVCHFHHFILKIFFVVLLFSL